MPTRPTKGDHGHNDSGSSESGNQKATFGSGVDPSVAKGQADAIEADAQQSADDSTQSEGSAQDAGSNQDD